eukprot:2538006-Alexandrium_andersonii.AAC.1
MPKSSGAAFDELHSVTRNRAIVRPHMDRKQLVSLYGQGNQKMQVRAELFSADPVEAVSMALNF